MVGLGADCLEVVDDRVGKLSDVFEIVTETHVIILDDLLETYKVEEMFERRESTESAASVHVATKLERKSSVI